MKISSAGQEASRQGGLIDSVADFNPFGGPRAILVDLADAPLCNFVQPSPSWTGPESY